MHRKAFLHGILDTSSLSLLRKLVDKKVDFLLLLLLLVVPVLISENYDISISTRRTNVITKVVNSYNQIQ